MAAYAAVTSRFLGEADFEGSKIAAGGPVTDGGQSTYIGLMSFSNVDHDTVASLLPPGFALAPRSTGDVPDVHPVVLLFGDQTDAMTLTGGAAVPTGIHYSEMIFAVPFVVQAASRARWHTHIIRMYLDNQVAVAAGEAFGYAKQLASLEWTGDDIRVWQGSDLLTGTFEWGSKWYDVESAFDEIPNFRDMVSIMTTRILGKKTVLGLPVPVCSHFEWDLRQARVAVAEGSYSMQQSFRPDMAAWPALSPFNNAGDGAVIVRGMHWRLSTLPELCA